MALCVGKLDSAESRLYDAGPSPGPCVRAVIPVAIRR